MQYAVCVQRTHYKSQAMLKMANAYYLAHRNNIDTKEFGNYLSSTIGDINEGQFLLKYDHDKKFPYVWIGGNESFQSYWKFLTLQNTIQNDENSTEFFRFYSNLQAYTINNDFAPYLLTLYKQKEYLLVWTIIPAPTPNEADYVYFTLTPTEDLMGRLASLKNEYTILFAFCTLMAGVLLILIPLTVKRFL
jgi:hypothetical protein